MVTRSLALTVAALVCANAQDVSSIQQRLEAQYALTKTTFDQSDIVTQGSVLTLKIDKIVMVPVNGQDIFQNKYQNGRITQNAVDKGTHILDKACGWISVFNRQCPTPASSVQLPKTHTFVAGEKLWVTGIHVNDSTVVFDLISDPYDNVRYKAALTIPTSPAQAEQTVAQIFAGESTASEASLPTTAAIGNQPVPPPAPPNADRVKVPPPPVAEPKLAVGQTTGQVMKILGEPKRRGTEPPNKTIYFYPNFKLIFVDDKLADFQ